MTQSHKSSIGILKNIIVPIDGNSTFLAHYDICESDVLSGIAPNSGAVFTLRPYEGKFGGGIAVEESTSNMLGSPTDGNWWINKNNYQGTVTATSQKNAPAFSTSARFDFQPRSNISGSGWQVAQYSVGLPWVSGNTYTWSIYLKRYTNDTVNIVLLDSNGLNPQGSTISCIPTLGEWQRFTCTWTATVTNGGGTFYMTSSETASFEVANPQIEQKSFATSFTNSSRSVGSLTYPANCIKPSQGTISYWYKPSYPSSSVTTQNNSPKMIQVGNYYSNSSITLWNMINGFSLYVKGATNSGWSLASGTGKAFPQNVWTMIAITWNGTTWKIYKDGLLIYTGTATETLGPIAGNIIYVGGDGNGTGSTGQVANGIIDELRIDIVARSDDEIASWYYSQAPFFPKGIWTVAY